MIECNGCLHGLVCHIVITMAKKHHLTQPNEPCKKRRRRREAPVLCCENIKYYIKLKTSPQVPLNWSTRHPQICSLFPVNWIHIICYLIWKRIRLLFLIDKRLFFCDSREGFILIASSLPWLYETFDFACFLWLRKRFCFIVIFWSRKYCISLFIHLGQLLHFLCFFFWLLLFFFD